MSRDPTKRLTKLEDLKELPWFKGINWEALENKTAKPPFVPDVSHDFVSLFVAKQS